MNKEKINQKTSNRRSNTYSRQKTLKINRYTYTKTSK